MTASETISDVVNALTYTKGNKRFAFLKLTTVIKEIAWFKYVRIFEVFLIPKRRPHIEKYWRIFWNVISTDIGTFCNETTNNAVQTNNSLGA